MQPPGRRRVPADVPAADRLLRAAALLRAGLARRLGQVVAVFLVPHTHWDREWYRPFQSFRISLVDVVDDVLDELERDEHLRFTLDGQLATVNDYLEIRPEAEERIRRLVTEGRLAIGPWQTLVDEFLVDGETIARNLEAGLARAAELGGTMRVGYLPDMFGHVAQMPQILRQAGIDTALVWRGVPSAVDFHRFVWEAPDGSSVVAEYLPGGYGNAAYSQSREALEQRYRRWFGDDDILGMVGTDHMPLVRDLPADGRVGTLAEYLADVRADGLRIWRGEMRSAARANLLPGVVSARIDLKAACSRAERWLERYAEPLQTLYGDDEPEPFLRQAWTRMFQNAAHDSICGCSADEVSAQVLVRYAEAEQIARELAQRAVRRIADQVPPGAFAVVNPSPRERTDVVELDVVVPDEWKSVALELPDGSQVPTHELARDDPLVWETKLPGAEVAVALARRVHGNELFGRYIQGYRIVEGEVVIEVGDDVFEWPAEQLAHDLKRATGQDEWTLRVVAQPKRTLAAAVPAPPLGWTSVRPRHVPGTVPGTCPQPAPVPRLVRGKDFGDSYNYAPPENDELVETPVAERRETVEDSSLRRIDIVYRTYVWDEHEVETATRLEQRAHEPFLRIRIEFDNPCDDQRVRVHVPLREPAESTLAEGQFAIVERGRSPEGGYGEVALATYPASAFVAAGGIVLLLEHVTEYELLDNELALTVLRSTGLISRSDNRYREDPAGPSLPIPAAQLRGPSTFSFAYLPSLDDVLENADAFRHPFLSAPGRSRTSAELAAQSGPSIEGHGVVLTSLRPGCARLVNESPHAVDASFAGRKLRFEPWQIQTAAPE
ncbi:MAG: alpha-mannosidase [Gaiellaceae bacterium]